MKWVRTESYPRGMALRERKFIGNVTAGNQWWREDNREQGDGGNSAWGVDGRQKAETFHFHGDHASLLNTINCLHTRKNTTKLVKKKWKPQRGEPLQRASHLNHIESLRSTYILSQDVERTLPMMRLLYKYFILGVLIVAQRVKNPTYYPWGSGCDPWPYSVG